jgi:hypothetical protein
VNFQLVSSWSIVLPQYLVIGTDEETRIERKMMELLVVNKASGVLSMVQSTEYFIWGGGVGGIGGRVHSDSTDTLDKIRNPCGTFLFLLQFTALQAKLRWSLW